VKVVLNALNSWRVMKTRSSVFLGALMDNSLPLAAATRPFGLERPMKTQVIPTMIVWLSPVVILKMSNLSNGTLKRMYSTQQAMTTQSNAGGMKTQ
jgi:hypothetical protein